MTTPSFIRWFDSLSRKDVALVGGKNASLGEMTQNLKRDWIRVPDGFAITAEAYQHVLETHRLSPRIADILQAFENGETSLAEAGHEIRSLIREASLPQELVSQIEVAYRALSARYGIESADVAVRSSATAEDLPEASFAGQHESFLNIQGEQALLDACKHCYASLFTDRAITYRQTLGIDSMEVSLSIGVQKMVEADCAGILFTIDTETGFPDVVHISGAWGLGEPIVQGAVTPDQFMVYKPFLETAPEPILQKTLGTKKRKMVYDTEGMSGSTKMVDTTPAEQSAFVLTNEEVLTLAHWGARIEAHYGYPMDVEWVRETGSGDLYVVQARPETVQSRRTSGTLNTYRLKERGEPLLTGLAIGGSIASGEACLIESIDDIDRFTPGAVLVTSTTDPDWVPIMKAASGIVTDHGGRTSHAAIVSRELGVPAVVGTGAATQSLTSGQAVTLSCAEGDQGYVYDGILPFEEEQLDLDALPVTRTSIMINLASPMAALQWWRLPARGVGLARMEYLISNVIQVHPMALLEDARLDEETKSTIEALTRGYSTKAGYFIDTLARGIATIAAAQYPEKVIVRTSDFKTNEYAKLIGGTAFEPDEQNPMLGWRGASRYYSDAYRAGFELECKAIKKAREDIGFDNVIVMIPFCRTPGEADRVLEVMAANGLRRGEKGLEIYVMAEIPSNVILAEAFAQRFDGFSIGSNDLTQLVLGIDRDSERLAFLFDERDEAVERMIEDLIQRAHAAGRPVGICGQGPSDHPDFAEFLVEKGIDSISLLPDSVPGVLQRVARKEASMQAHKRLPRAQQDYRLTPHME